jgi:uncharacterized protein
MNTTIKNIIGAVAILATLSLAYAAFMYIKIYDRSSEPTNFRSFTVQADGKSVGTPDIAEFSFDVITEGGNDVAKLQTENTTKMNKALEYVKGKGIDKKDLATQQYSIEPRYQTTPCDYTSGKPCPPAEIVGYTVRQSANVKIRDFSLISGLLTGVVDSGANSVSQLQFTIDDPTKLENDARAEAIRKAQQKADSIAKAAGFSIGRLISINENFYPIYAQRDMMASGIALEKSAPAPTIEPGSQEISVTINLQYEIK